MVSIFETPIGIIGKAEGTTVYVNTTGSGGAFSSIQAAINASNPGDMVYVFSGTYYENVDVNKAVSLVGESNQTTIIDGMGGDDVIIVNAQWAHLTGFTIQNSVTGIYLPNSNATVENMIIDLGSYYGIEYGSYGDHDNPTIRNNIIKDCSNTCIDVRYGAGGIIENNTVYANTHGRGIRVNGDPLIIGNTIRTYGGNSQGIQLSSGADVDIIENKIYSMASFGLYSCAVESQYGIGRIYNCSFEYPETLNEFVLGYGGNLTLYNSTYDSIYYYSDDSDSIVTSKWWIDVHVKDPFGNPISGAEVSIENVTGELEYHGFTNSQGFILMVPLTQRTEIIGMNITYTPHTFNASKGNESEVIIFEINQNRVIEIILNVGGPVYNVDKGTYHVTIQDAIDHADSGNTITVSNGTYNETIVIDKTINLQGKDLNNVIIDGKGSENVIEIKANNVNITGFTIINGSNGIYAISVYYNNIQGNNISSNSGSGINFESSNNNDVISNMFHSNVNGINFNGSHGNNIIGNTLRSNDMAGFYLSGSNNNVFHHNNIMYNGIFQVEIQNCTNNYWDDGEGWGNFWSDYEGIDDGSNNRLANDGVGDTKYPHPFADMGRGYYRLDMYPVMDPSPDTLAPRINLKSPWNNSIIKIGAIIDFEIIDGNLDFVNYSINNLNSSSFLPPYDISTSEWIEGPYSIQISAFDAMGNFNIQTFFFTVDNTRPHVITSSIENNSENIEINILIKITFSEEMNKSSAEDGVYLFPFTHFKSSLSPLNDVLYILFENDNLSYDTRYTIIIDSSITDRSGNAMDSDFILVFKTEKDPIEKESKMDENYWMWILLLLVIISVFIIIFIAKRGKKSREITNYKDVPEGDDVVVVELEPYPPSYKNEEIPPPQPPKPLPPPP
jgi:parallel beta-helix repeat protein